MIRRYMAALHDEEAPSPLRGLITERRRDKHTFQTLHLNTSNSIMMLSVI